MTNLECGAASETEERRELQLPRRAQRWPRLVRHADSRAAGGLGFCGPGPFFISA